MPARTGEEALALARSVRPKVITLDLVLPGLDGWEVLKRLKADEQTRDIPVVIVSVLEDRELGVALGAEGYFQKPVDGPALLERVASIAELLGVVKKLAGGAEEAARG